MSSLFILNNHNNLEQCLQAMSEQDALLLIEDGVLAVNNTLSSKTYVLEEDLIARGLNNVTLDHVEKIDYSAFVELTLQLDKTVSWL